MKGYGPMEVEIPFDSKISEYLWLLIVNCRTRILLCFGGFFLNLFYLQANSNDVTFLVVVILLICYFFSFYFFGELIILLFHLYLFFIYKLYSARKNSSNITFIIFFIIYLYYLLNKYKITDTSGSLKKLM